MTHPETIVVHKGHGLPYSKGLMAQSLQASGLTPERSFELAREIERRLALRGDREVGVDGLDAALPWRSCAARRARARFAATRAGAASTASTGRWSF